MALPSQTGRTQSRHSYTYRRGSSLGIGGRGKRGSRRPLLLAILVIFGISLTVWVFRSWRSPDEAGGPAPAVADVLEEKDELPSSALAQSQPTIQETLRSMQPEQPSDSHSGPTRNDQPRIRMGEQTQAQANPADSMPIRTEQAQPTVESRSPEPDPAPVVREEKPSLPAVPTSRSRDRAVERWETGLELIRSNRPIDARRVLTQAFAAGSLSRADAAKVRDALTELNDRLVFSPEIVSGDPFTYGYAVRPGGSLSQIASQERLNVDWRLIQRINRIPRPEQIRPGQQLKLIKGPFHAVVHKRDFRMDVYLGEGDDRVFVRSFSVGLGEYDSTPLGTFRVRPNSKLINPEWVNPRTGERFSRDDPKNPIGERWIGLEGVSESVRDLGGYGIHGTIEPDSIGAQASMGCVRMLSDDVELVYELLAEGLSTVEIRE